MIFEEEIAYQDRARELIKNYYNSNVAGVTDVATDYVTLEQVYVVWFVKVLKNWKALVATTNPDGRYFEVTYDGEKCQSYIDNYLKTHNIAVPDGKPVDQPAFF